jgi:crossover junction endodeoxyribonuclease RusA
VKATLWLPAVVPSAANLREHWATRARRAKKHRFDAELVTRLGVRGSLSAALRSRGGTVRLLLIGHRKRDSDNLAASLKAIRDGIADGLGLDDGDARLQWVYVQGPGSRTMRGVEIEVGVGAK